MKLIGLLGATFDPPHRGHLAMAMAAFTELGCAEVRLIPAGDPWQKRDHSVTPAQQRVAMTAALIETAKVPGLIIDARETQRSGATYTIDTLRELRAELGPNVSLVWLIGADAFARLTSWDDWPLLFELCHFAVASRPASLPKDWLDHLPLALSHAIAARSTQQPAFLQNAAAGLILLNYTEPPTVSSTAIRAVCATLNTANALVNAATLLTPPVLNYIRDHSLYAVTPMATKKTTTQKSASAVAPQASPTAPAELEGAALSLKKKNLIIDALEDIKARDILVFDLHTSVADFNIIATAESNRQTRALAHHLHDKLRDAGHPVLGIEGEETGEWVLVDSGDMVVHIMQPQARVYYNLEELWLAGKMERVEPAEIKAAKRRAEMAAELKATKAPAKKAAVKKVAAKKVAVKAAAKIAQPVATKVTKAAVKKTATAKTPIVEAPVIKAPVVKPAITKAVVKKVAAKQAVVKKVVAKKAVSAPVLTAPVVAKKAVAKQSATVKRAAAPQAKAVVSKPPAKATIVVKEPGGTSTRRRPRKLAD